MKRESFALIVVLSSILFLSCGGEKQRAWSIDGLSPKTAFSGQKLEVTISGGPFPAGEWKARLVGVDRQKYPLSKVRRISEVQIRAELPEELPEGLYDLELEHVETAKVELLGGAFEVLPSGFQLYFVDVGQGDATLLITPKGETFLLDGGPPANFQALEALMRSLKITKIDYLLASHYDLDHVGGFYPLVAGPDGELGTSDDRLPKKLYDRGGWSKNKLYSKLRAFLKDRHVSLRAEGGKMPVIELEGGVKLELFAVDGTVKTRGGQLKEVKCGRDENCRSIGVRVSYGRFSFWNGGDLSGGGNDTPDLESLLGPAVGPVTVYHAHHHGSKTGSNSNFLTALKPKLIVISVGRDNDYCHPHADTIRRITALKEFFLALTSEGITRSGRCGPLSTSERLAKFAHKTLLDGGTIRLTVKKKVLDIFSMKLKKKVVLSY